MHFHSHRTEFEQLELVAVERKGQDQQREARGCGGAAGGHFSGRGDSSRNLRLPGSRTSPETSEVRGDRFHLLLHDQKDRMILCV